MDLPVSPVIPTPEGVDDAYATARQEVVDFYWSMHFAPTASEPEDWTRAHQYAIEDLIGSTYVTWAYSWSISDWIGGPVAYFRNLALVDLVIDVGRNHGINPGYQFEFTDAAEYAIGRTQF